MNIHGNKNFFVAGLLCISLLAILFLPGRLFADTKGKDAEVYFSNGDKVTGRILSEEGDIITLENDALGELKIKKSLVSKILTKEEERDIEAQIEELKTWKKELGIGYSQSQGNTKKSNASVTFTADKKTEKDEINIKANSFYSSANKKMDSQKWYGMGRYGISIWGGEWFNFYKLETDHDRFANINYRVTPSAGFGYWFSDAPNCKTMTELGIGSEYTNYRDDTKNTSEAILISRTFLGKKLFGESYINEDFTIYPSLKNSGEYRLHSETAFTSPISREISLKLSLVDDFKSNPAKGKKKNDLQIISSLNYSF